MNIFGSWVDSWTHHLNHWKVCWENKHYSKAAAGSRKLLPDQSTATERSDEEEEKWEGSRK